MDLSEYKSKFKTVLSPLYDQRSIDQMWRLYLEDVIQPNGFDLSIFERDLQDLAAAKPIQYVTGIADFYGLRIPVSPAVLIPRPETEELAHWVGEELANSTNKLEVLDIGTGSACIPIYLCKQYPEHHFSAIEVDEYAFAQAQSNINSFALNIHLTKLDFLDELAWGLIDVPHILISNPPYIATKDKSKMSSNVLDYEPHIALFAGDDTLIFYKKIAAFAERKMVRGSKIYLEINEFYREEIEAIFSAKFNELESKKDMQGFWRMMKVTV